ncbi:Ran-binding protein 9 [Golovinomyces cichoracearum]|uniref:Ran-binding protein 9 n=1 Tax=Golovinomyces cichoracearum TaxID=62708 RepID=A0A420IWV1_9PEZI|nr:Ran-binding protein 9 [Golovinomyces cichoracearum]
MQDSSSSTGAPRFIPRRSSHASAVPGATSVLLQSHSNPTRSGDFINLNQGMDTPHDLNHPFTGSMRLDSNANEHDNSTSDASHENSKFRSRSAQLPSFLSTFGALVNEPGRNHLAAGYNDYFFIPSYLNGSVYVQELQEAYRAKQISNKNNTSTQSPLACSLSNSKSMTNLNARMVPSNQVMAYDLIEKVSVVGSESLPPLPSKWSSHDKQPALEVLCDGLEVKLSSQKPEREREHESCAIRANHSMPSQCGLYYFEVTILDKKREESSIGIGFSSKKVPLTRLPGWEPESWAYHGDDGDLYCSQTSGKAYGPPFSANDVIGCGVNFKTSSAFFTKNGVHLGTAFRDIKGELYPSVGMKKPGEHVKVNFGQGPFIFDIDGMMEREKSIIESEIEAASTDSLAPPKCETELIQALVLQFLKHDGFVESARVFAKEVHFEKKALSLDPEVALPSFDIKEEEDASQRQRIRAAILDGDIDTALKYTNLHFPQVLKTNEKVYFRLRCRKFIEMIRQAAELQNSNLKNTTNSEKNDGDWYDDVLNQQMDLDEYEPTSPNHDRMETEVTSNSYSEHTQLLQETIKYGTELSAEYKNDPRKEIKKALEDAFALMAYQEPLNAKGVAHLLDPYGRVAVAEELNSAILQSLGKSSASILELLYQQTSVLLEDLRHQGGSAAAFLNIDDYLKPKMCSGPGRQRKCE